FKAGKARKAFDFGTKFGVLEAGAIEIAAEVKRRGYAASLCFHVGSQCEEVAAYDRHIAAAGRIAKGADITLRRLNVGGGFPAPYPSSGAPELDVYFETIRKATVRTFGSSAPELIVEPGRAMVTSSTSLLLRVKHQRAGRSVYVNDGAYGALMEVKFMPILPPTRVWRGAEILGGETAEFTIWGPTCDSYDVLPQLFDFPKDIGEDDWVEFGLLGAYSQASTTSFNGFDKRLQYAVDSILI
ncbi:MAG: type III PLP-dependent enzyme, partial [Alphaproteobacteria bacterium]|nr:type III PLP-dependent enzyme [Alphaproteobacteria bacterium]